jgi:hypothetical protein
MGMAEYRAGLYKSALGRLEKCHEPVPKTDEDATRKAMADLFRAMIYAQGEKPDLAKARSAIREGVRVMDHLLQKKDRADLDSWVNWIQFRIVRMEAEALIKDKGKVQSSAEASQ